MKNRRPSIFILVMIIFGCGLVILTDMLLGAVGINREYRLTNPDRMHRKDRHLLFIERSYLDLQVPIMPTIVFDQDKREPLYYWHVKTNKWGMNEDDFAEEKPDHVRRIICLGDSCTFGWGVSREQGYVRLLHQELARSSLPVPVEVLNAGHTGFTSFQGRVLMERYIRFWQPDFVTFCFGANDHLIHGAAQTDKEAYHKNQTFQYRALSFLEKSNWFLLMARSIRKISSAKTQTVSKHSEHINRVAVQDFAENLLAMVSVCRQIRAVPIFLTQPYFQQQPGDDVYYQTMLARAARESVVLVDCAQQFHRLKQEWGLSLMMPNRLYIDGIHPQAEGHHIVAGMTAEALKPLLTTRQQGSGQGDIGAEEIGEQIISGQ